MEQLTRLANDMLSLLGGHVTLTVTDCGLVAAVLALICVLIGLQENVSHD